MSRMVKTAKRGFWRLLGPLAHLLPNETLPLPPSPSLLFLRPDRLGDFILTAPALWALMRRAGPSARFTLVAGKANEALARALFPDVRVWVDGRNIFSRIVLYLRLLWNHFDAAIDFHSFPFSTTTALMALTSGSPRRIGFTRSEGQGDESMETFNWGVPSPSLSLHESRKSHLLARRLFPGLAFPNLKHVFKLNLEEASRSVGNYFKEQGVKPGDLLIGLHPTLAKEDNRWSSTHYLRLMSLYSPRKEFCWVLFHGRGEDQQLESFKKKMEEKAGIVILPTDDLFHLLAAASRCRVVVLGDSGLTHACAIVTRVLALFGPSDPKQWGPLILNGPMVLRSKDLQCDSISPEKVAAALRKLISAR